MSFSPKTKVLTGAGPHDIKCKNIRAFGGDASFIAIPLIGETEGCWSSDGTSTGAAKSLIQGGDFTPEGVVYNRVSTITGDVIVELVYNGTGN